MFRLWKRQPVETEPMTPAEEVSLFEQQERDYALYVYKLYGWSEEEIETQVQRAEEQLAILQANIERLQSQGDRIPRGERRRLSASYSEKKRVQGTLTQLKNKLVKTMSVEACRAQYREIRAVPRILDAFVDPPRLVYITDVLFGRDRQGVWRRVGPFRISFDLLNPTKQTFIWTNLDGPVCDLQGPPNIALDGKAGCMGNQADVIMKAAGDARDYVTLVELSVRYPECHGQHNVIDNWPSVPEKEVPDWYRENFRR